MNNLKTPFKTKGFRFWLPKFENTISMIEWNSIYNHPKITTRRIKELQQVQQYEAHDTLTDLLKQVDERIKWARTRSQSEKWWCLETRTYSQHMELVEGFELWANRLKTKCTWALMSAIWTRLNRQPWKETYKHLNLANSFVNEINGSFR